MKLENEIIVSNQLQLRREKLVIVMGPVGCQIKFTAITLAKKCKRRDFILNINQSILKKLKLILSKITIAKYLNTRSTQNSDCSSGEL